MSVLSHVLSFSVLVFVPEYNFLFVQREKVWFKLCVCVCFKSLESSLVLLKI